MQMLNQIRILKQLTGNVLEVALLTLVIVARTVWRVLREEILRTWMVRTETNVVVASNLCVDYIHDSFASNAKEQQWV